MCRAPMTNNQGEPVVKAAGDGAADDRHAPERVVLGRHGDGVLVADDRAVVAVVLLDEGVGLSQVDGDDLQA